MASNESKFEIDELQANEKSRIIVSFKRTTLAEDNINTGTSRNATVVGFITGDLSISIGSNHNTPFESSAQESFTEVLNKAQGALATLGFGGMSPITVKTFAQTVNNWNGTDRPSFSVPLKFMRLRDNESDDVRHRVKLLYETVMPASTEFIFAGVMQPPLNYLPVLGTESKSARGTMVVTIGTWFQATNLVMKNVSFDFSRQVVHDGSPLFATGNITFEPYRMPTLSEFLGYFGTFNNVAIT